MICIRKGLVSMSVGSYLSDDLGKGQTAVGDAHLGKFCVRIVYEQKLPSSLRLYFKPRHTNSFRTTLAFFGMSAVSVTYER